MTNDRNGRQDDDPQGNGTRARTVGEGIDLPRIMAEGSRIPALLVERGRITSVNRAASEQLGEGLAGRQLREITSAGSQSKLVSALAQRDAMGWEFMLELRPGDTPAVQRFLFLPRHPGAHLLLATSVTDVDATATLLSINEQLANLTRELARQRWESESAKARLEEERRFVSTILEIVPIAVIVTDASGRILRCNPEAERAAGLPSHHMRNLKVWNVPTLAEPDRQALSESFHSRAPTSGQPVKWGIETSFLEPGGKARRLVWTVAAHHEADGRIAFLVGAGSGGPARRRLEIDNVERQRAEAAARLAAETSRVLSASLDEELTLNKVAELAVSHLCDACVIDVIEEGGALRRVGIAHRDPAEVAAIRSFVKTHPVFEDVARYARRAERAILGKVDDAMIERLAYDEEHARLMRRQKMRFMMSIPLKARGRTVGILTLGRQDERPFGCGDLAVVEEVAARTALAIENAQLYRTAMRAIRNREDLLAVVAHDLRSPLSAIGLAAKLLGSTDVPGAAGDAVRSRAACIQRQASRMERLAGDLLDAAAIEAGRFSVAVKPHDLSPLVDEVIETMQPLAAERDLHLRRQLAAPLPLVDCDRGRIVQVFTNLIGNAIKFTPVRGTITISATSDDEFVRFAVADTGHGIADNVLPHLFDRYFKASAAEHKGAGLGLYIVKGIVEAHRGKVWAESRPGEGATFYVRLPVSACVK